MDIQAIRDSLPDYARDLRLNLGSVLAPTGAPGLTEAQIWGIALASAITARTPTLTAAVACYAREHGGDATVDAAKAAAAGISREAIQSAVRIAAVINAAAGTLACEQAA